tara:strand:+ start:183 stop:776 length:594 start_codon:yes stop_codon:yes gene_type:complete
VESLLNKMEEENFIGIFKNAFTKKFCERYINIFETYKKSGLTFRRNRPEISDESISIPGSLLDDLESINLLHYSKEFNEIFFPLYDQYAAKFSILNRVSKHAIYEFKLQKTCLGEGYHVWHTEHETKMTRDRILAFTLYLNTIEEGGETEFLYLKKRVKPVQGTCLIWPSGFTHTHRGNSPISKDKYIITGWLEYGV